MPKPLAKRQLPGKHTPVIFARLPAVSEHHHLPDGLPRCKALEALVDFVEPDAVRHQLLDRQLAGLHHGGKARMSRTGTHEPT